MNESKLFILSEEKLSDYEITILYYALAYNDNTVFSLKESDILEISNMLSIDYNLLSKALTTNIKRISRIKIGSFIIANNSFSLDEIKCLFGEKYVPDYNTNIKNNDYYIFYMLIQIYSCYKNFNAISYSSSIEEINEKIELLINISCFFTSLNCNTGYFENCNMPEFNFEYKFNMYNEKFSSQIDLLNCLKGIVCFNTSGYKIFELDYYNVLCDSIIHELKCRITAINLIVALQIIKHSPIFTNDIKEMAHELYNYFLNIFRNGRIISVKFNSKYFNTNIDVSKRTKDDNTTRLEILYGFSNYDDYALRLDYAHGFIEYAHFNNISPGKNKAFLFKKHQYEMIIKDHPDFKDLFIKYPDNEHLELPESFEHDIPNLNEHVFNNSTIFALKEKINCNLTSEQSTIYDKICSTSDHIRIFKKNYEEKDIEMFLNIFSMILPNNFKNVIDTEQAHATNCFYFDKFMSEVMNLCLIYGYSIYSKQQIDTSSIFKRLGNLAFTYKYIDSNDKDEIKTFEDIDYIINIAKEMI